MKKNLKVPKLKNENRERDFWAKINLADYFESSDFQTNSPYRISVQPVSAVLGATVAALLIAMTHRKFPDGMGIPISRNTTINTFYINRVLFSTAGDCITGVGWVK